VSRRDTICPVLGLTKKSQKANFILLTESVDRIFLENTDFLVSPAKTVYFMKTNYLFSSKQLISSKQSDVMLVEQSHKSNKSEESQFRHFICFRQNN
jgi:hypothetical protein